MFDGNMCWLRLEELYQTNFSTIKQVRKRCILQEDCILHLVTTVPLEQSYACYIDNFSSVHRGAASTEHSSWLLQIEAFCGFPFLSITTNSMDCLVTQEQLQSKSEKYGEGWDYGCSGYTIRAQ
ncbi:hypothetical protein Nepgr_008226 [Nepenthes gracilis]|uniref:Uncharacterized protein n=1 Tax=Nepenthes gracilis TaxID=150966 RepID=A0AAD3S8N7_NEPGR|nr:hypothetical protein Nepgr_008226 [Nepenthes gracilis]